jgi:hypothetical protein
MPVLELKADEEFGRIMHKWIRSHKESLIWIYAKEQSRVQALRILPNQVFVSVVLASIFDLKTPFVVRPILRRCAGSEKSIGDDTESLACGRLERNDEWCPSRM